MNVKGTIREEGMTDQSPDLSKRRRPRTTPRPPADYGTDSAEVPDRNHATSPSATNSPAFIPDDDPVVQLNTRVAYRYKQRLAQLSTQRHQTIRSLIEQALDATYGEDAR